MINLIRLHISAPFLIHKSVYSLKRNTNLLTYLKKPGGMDLVGNETSKCMVPWGGIHLDSNFRHRGKFYWHLNQLVLHLIGWLLSDFFLERKPLYRNEQFPFMDITKDNIFS